MEDLLFLAHRLPYPPDKGDRIRSWNMLLHLADRYRIHLGCFVDNPDNWRHAEVVASRCASHCFLPLGKLLPAARGCLSMLAGGSLSVGYLRDRTLAGFVSGVIAENRPTRAFVFGSALASYVMGDAARGMHRTIDMVDVDSEKWRQYAERRSWPMKAVFAREARALLAFERSAAMNSDATLFVSGQEAALFGRLAPECTDHVHAISNGVDAGYFDPARSFTSPFAPGEMPIVFTGAMDYWPNIDAITWFVREVMPLLASTPARFYIVGSNPTPAVKRLSADRRVVVTGRVPDVRPYLAHAAVVVAPLRLARGIQNKVLEAMAMAAPVIATSAAIDGIDVVRGRHVMSAESPAEFAAAIERCGFVGRALGASARERVLECYTWAQNLGRLDEVLRVDSADTVVPLFRSVG